MFATVFGRSGSRPLAARPLGRPRLRQQHRRDGPAAPGSVGHRHRRATHRLATPGGDRGVPVEFALMIGDLAGQVCSGLGEPVRPGRDPPDHGLALLGTASTRQRACWRAWSASPRRALGLPVAPPRRGSVHRGWCGPPVRPEPDQGTAHPPGRPQRPRRGPSPPRARSAPPHAARTRPGPGSRRSRRSRRSSSRRSRPYRTGPCPPSRQSAAPARTGRRTRRPPRPETGRSWCGRRVLSAQHPERDVGDAQPLDLS